MIIVVAQNVCLLNHLSSFSCHFDAIRRLAIIVES